MLRANKALALTGIGLTLGAALLGGSQAPLMVQNHGTRSWLGLDFFVLNLLLYSAVFIPLERLFALRGDQPVFRRHWLVDLTYFFVNSLLIEVLTILTLQPALILFDWARLTSVSHAVASLPLVVQVPVIILIADFTQYWVHRTFHSVTLSLAISRDSPLRRGDGLAGRLPAASRRRDSHPRLDVSNTEVTAHALRWNGHPARVSVHDRTLEVTAGGIRADSVSSRTSIMFVRSTESLQH